MFDNVGRDIEENDRVWNMKGRIYVYCLGIVRRDCQVLKLHPGQLPISLSRGLPSIYHSISYYTLLIHIDYPPRWLLNPYTPQEIIFHR